MLVRNKSIFVCVSIIISILINYQKPLHSKEVEDIDSLISSMWDRIGNEVDGISSSKQSEYEGKLTEKFKVRGINETKLGKERIEELKTEFSKSLKKHYPKKDKAKYKSRILGVEADKRDEEINKIIQEEVNSAQTSFNSFLNTKNNEIQEKVSETEKEVVKGLVDEIVTEIGKIVSSSNEKLSNEIKKKTEKDNEYYEKEIQELYEKCKKSIEQIKGLTYSEKITEFKRCENSKKLLKDSLNKNKVENIQQLMTGDYKDITKEIEGLIEKNKGKTIKEIKTKILEEYDKNIADKNEKVLEIFYEQSNKQKEKFNELVKGEEDDSERILKKLKELQIQKEIESKMTEEEKKQKAEAERLQKEIDNFMNENKNKIIEDDNVLRKVMSCNNVPVIMQEGNDLEYCSKWVIGYSAEKLYTGEAKTVKDLEFKAICKTKEKLKLDFNTIDKDRPRIGHTISFPIQNHPNLAIIRFSGLFTRNRVNISHIPLAEIVDTVYYTCPSGYHLNSSNQCVKVDSYVCDDRRCFDLNSNAVCWGCIRGCGLFCLTVDDCCWTTGLHQEGYECYNREYNYVPGDEIPSLADLLDRDEWGKRYYSGMCVKTITRSATAHKTHKYYVYHCDPVINADIDLEKLYDPNFVMFQ